MPQKLHLSISTAISPFCPSLNGATSSLVGKVSSSLIASWGQAFSHNIQGRHFSLMTTFESSFEKSGLSSISWPSMSILIAFTGQKDAHMPQKVHLVWSMITGGASIPVAISKSGPASIAFAGHTSIHIPQPLHRL